jgi:hypothetical protein
MYQYENGKAEERENLGQMTRQHQSLEEVIRIEA